MLWWYQEDVVATMVMHGSNIDLTLSAISNIKLCCNGTGFCGEVVK